jgi:hypothetical protein
LLALSELTRRIAGEAPALRPETSLTPYELRVFSQNGEDGVIAEILRRAGIADGWFVEFGAADGVQKTARSSPTSSDGPACSSRPVTTSSIAYPSATPPTIA